MTVCAKRFKNTDSTLLLYIHPIGVFFSRMWLTIRLFFSGEAHNNVLFTDTEILIPLTRLPNNLGATC
jgi:hypothetical protein